MNVKFNSTKFDAPVLGQDAQELYKQLYGKEGECFVNILNTSPDEIAVISRLISYLRLRKGSE